MLYFGPVVKIHSQVPVAVPLEHSERVLELVRPVDGVQVWAPFPLLPGVVHDETAADVVAEVSSDLLDALTAAAIVRLGPVLRHLEQQVPARFSLEVCIVRT